MRTFTQAMRCCTDAASLRRGGRGLKPPLESRRIKVAKSRVGQAGMSFTARTAIFCVATRCLHGHSPAVTRAQASPATSMREQDAHHPAQRLGGAPQELIADGKCAQIFTTHRQL